MAAHLEEDFPLFPLGIVALPGEAVPLHIFEARYRTMVDDCLVQERNFGIVWLSDEGLAEIGCACEIERVLERMDDGRINLVARGRQPLRVLERQNHLPYPAGVVELLEDSGEPPDADLLTAAQQAYAELVRRASDREPDPQQLAEMSAYAMAATVDFGAEAKQKLLDLRSENARLDLATRLFRAAHRRLDFVTGAQAQAQANGKVHLV